MMKSIERGPNFKALIEHKAALIAMRDIVRGMESIFNHAAKEIGRTNPDFKHVCEEVAMGLDAVVHDASLDWIIANVEKAERGDAD